ncbi:aspartate aminotransferase isoform B [Micractinium conductrix]|uniref:Aspartate aminotransferase n=1 Tax=Micractinium conductrix TaxID=554055 RepID=A0A2P6V4Q5_9CHLO|nr:aspartate aminotransferase isoform B [Micractinium conductrix]|eukprot:PSC69059.1 aspartate aminotransferase isoform B [Micractinium conductrix]
MPPQPLTRRAGAERPRHTQAATDTSLHRRLLEEAGPLTVGMLRSVTSFARPSSSPQADEEAPGQRTFPHRRGAARAPSMGRKKSKGNAKAERVGCPTCGVMLLKAFIGLHANHCLDTLERLDQHQQPLDDGGAADLPTSPPPGSFGVGPSPGSGGGVLHPAAGAASGSGGNVLQRRLQHHLLGLPTKKRGRHGPESEEDGGHPGNSAEETTAAAEEGEEEGAAAMHEGEDSDEDKVGAAQPSHRLLAIDAANRGGWVPQAAAATNGFANVPIYSCGGKKWRMYLRKTLTSWEATGDPLNKGSTALPKDPSCIQLGKAAATLIYPCFDAKAITLSLAPIDGAPANYAEVASSPEKRPSQRFFSAAMVLGLGGASRLPPRGVPPQARQQRDDSLPHASHSSALGRRPAACPPACTLSSVGTPRGDTPVLQQPGHSSDQSQSQRPQHAEPASSDVPAHPQLDREQQLPWEQQLQEQGPAGDSRAHPQACAAPAAEHRQAAGPAASSESTRKRQHPDSRQHEASKPRRTRLAVAAPVSSGAAGSSSRQQLQASRAARGRNFGGGGAAPPAKRPRGVARGVASRNSMYADVLHRWVDVPGSVFSVPNEKYPAQVTKAECGRKVPAVEVDFKDGDKYWFPLADVRRWMSEMGGPALVGRLLPAAGAAVPVVARALSTAAGWFGHVTEAPRDPILGVTEKYLADTNPMKINLGVGAYRDDSGQPWVLPSVREAERRVSGSHFMEYLPIGGHRQFCEDSVRLAYGEHAEVIKGKQVAMLQSLSGTGSCRLFAEFQGRWMKGSKIYIPQPTWSNHHNIFKDAHVHEVLYPYYKPETRGLDLEGLLDCLSKAPAGSVVMLHACAHNPTGVDPTTEQWQQISGLMREKRLFPFFDMAYQGFATGDCERDAQALRIFLQDGHRLALSQSYAKNMGLYGQRVGCFSIVCDSPSEAKAVESQMKALARPMYSNPPLHGALLVHQILSDPSLKRQWFGEVKLMADRIISMRTLLRENLEQLGNPLSWNHITDQIGMFCFTGLTPEQVNKLTNEHSIYLTRNGRISMAGVNTGNVSQLAQAIHSAREEGYQAATQVHKDSYLRGKGVDQTDQSGDPLVQAQQREGAVQMATEHLHPADRAAAEGMKAAEGGAGAPADQPRGGGATAGGGYGAPGTSLARVSEAAGDLKAKLKTELKDAVHDVDAMEPGEAGEVPS